MSALWRMLCADVRHHGRRLVLVGAGLSCAAALFTLLCAFGLGLRTGLLAQFGRALPGHMVEVKRQSVQVGPLELNLGGMLGDDPLTLALVPELEHLPHVRRAYPILDVALPMAAQGGAGLFGRTLATQIFMSAVPPDLVGGEFLKASLSSEGPVPVVVHDSLVALYNSTVAPALGTPKVTSEALVGLSFDIVIGQSPLMPTSPGGQIGRLRAKIVGTSPYALPMGISVPWDTGLRLLTAYGNPPGSQGDAAPLRAVLLQADGPESLLGLGQEVAAFGLHVDDTATQVGQMLRAMVVVLGLFGLFGLALAGLGTVYAFSGYVQARGRELGLVRIVGATPLFIATWMLTEAAMMGALCGAVGVGAAYGAAQLALVWFGPSLATVPLLPEHLFEFSAPLMALAGLLAVATATLGALGPTLHACWQPLARHTHPQ